MNTFIIKSGDTQPPLEAGLLSAGQPVDLSTATDIRLHMRAVSGGALVIDEAMTVVGTAADGVVRYQWVDGDTDVAGNYYAEYIVTWPDGEQTFPVDDYCLVQITASLEATTGTLPDLPDECWPVDESACPALADFPLAVRALARAYAGQTLRMLTGYVVGGCPITVRPCSVACLSATSNWFDYGPGWAPSDWNGQWINSCGCATDCEHLGLASITLPGPIGEIVEVLIDGEVLDEDSYRVDNGNQLVRIDGEVWPMYQDMLLAPTEVDTFAVTYLRGYKVDGLGAYAAGVLACEFAVGMTGGECRLPSGVTAITRLGVTMVLEPGIFTSGQTGIREVDVYIQRWNPNHLRAPSTVWSPDLQRFRTTTWTS